MKLKVLLPIFMVSLTGCQTFDARLNAFRMAATDSTEIPIAEEFVPIKVDWKQYSPNELPRTDWIASFDDPLLPALVTEALQANPDIGRAVAAYEAALARTEISRADRRPGLDASLGASRSEYANSLLSDSTSFSAGLSASWEADLWGRIGDQIGVSELDASAAQADLAGARLAITNRVAQTWYDLIEARLLSELSIRDVETKERALRLTERRFKGGVAQSSDVRLARSSLASAQALQASRLQRQSALSRSLEILLRRYPDEALQAAADLPSLPPLAGAGLPTNMLTLRPDILAIERRLEASGLNVDAARKALLPRLSFSGGISDGSTRFQDLFDWQSLLASLAINLAAPIYDGGRIRANVDLQEALVRQQAESYAAAVLGGYLEVENALDAETRLAESEQALRVSLEEAIQAETRLERRYAEGLASILELLDAQSRRISAESQLISARKARLINRIQLHVALGGGLYGSTELPVTHLYDSTGVYAQPGVTP